jgi:HSP20 family protein
MEENMASNFLDIVRNRLSSPYRELAHLQSEFDRLANDMMGFRSGAPSTFEFSPSCEVCEEESFYVAKFDIPGVNKDDIKIHLEGNQLTVSAERKEEKRSDEKKTRYSEISYGSYMRTFSLPAPVDEKKIEAKLDNGVLTVKIPKAQASKAKQIEIH